MSETKKESTNISGKDFIREIIIKDLENGKNEGRVHTRFPPEPNGYLHIGHAKSIVLNFSVAEEFHGLCNLRFDDTNPEREQPEYVESIMEDVKWLGYDWDDRLYFASDYYEKMYEYAEELIRRGKAYVCDLPPEKIKEYRGTLTEPGIPSPYRERSVEENLQLFRRMRAGEFKDGEKVLRAKIDMASSNLNMRDPVIYRIKHVSHHRTGDKWCIYPMYDYAHCLSDSIEGITHSLCTLEFENHRPLYDWFLDQLEVEHHPQQIEFAPLNITYTVLSKRKLLRLVEGGHVDGWDDPRMPTIAGMRRRGYPAAAIRNFCKKVGVAKKESVVDIALLEHAVRDELNRTAPRRMAVLHPLKITLKNYPEGLTEEMEAINNPEDASMGTRKVPFSKYLYIERNDFRENPHRKYYRLAPGREVRLRYAYIIRCEEVIKDPESGEVIELICTYDPETRGGNAPDGRKIRGTIQWISAAHAVASEIRLYDRLFNKPNPEDFPEGGDFTDNLNQDSLQVITEALVEPSLANPEKGITYQFERIGYFCPDPVIDNKHKPVFNRTASLRDSWAKIEKKYS